MIQILIKNKDCFILNPWVFFLQLQLFNQHIMNILNITSVDTAVLQMNQWFRVINTLIWAELHRRALHVHVPTNYNFPPDTQSIGSTSVTDPAAQVARRGLVSVVSEIFGWVTASWAPNQTVDWCHVEACRRSFFFQLNLCLLLLLLFLNCDWYVYFCPITGTS